jgi:ABC-type sugar transport system ATPase subunit
MVHQELAFCENLSVEENLSLGRLPARWGIVSRGAMRSRAHELLDDIGASVDPSRKMESLSVAEQQLVQIAAAVGSNARIIVFDEPTSSLSEGEAARLYALVGRLCARGVTVIYVSHRMPEIFRLASRVTVLRDGEHVATRPAASVDEGALVRLMIGRDIERYFPAHVNTEPGEELLRAERISCAGKFENISFSLRAGEVLGLAGLVGAGRSELARALFGLESPVTGTVHAGGKQGYAVRIRSPRDAMALGIGLVPEDRKHQGLILSMTARENVSLPILQRLSRRTFIRLRAERQLTQDYCDRLSVRAPTLDVQAAALSGGNQQKLVLARWLAARSRVLILDEPTRGVDVGAKAELHAWIDKLASDGHAVLLISSELPELLNLSTRILVLRHGRVTGEVSREEATQDVLLRLMAGLPPEAISA